MLFSVSPYANTRLTGDGRWSTRWGAFTRLAPVYRLYNPNASLHVYTESRNERATLISLAYSDESHSPTTFSNFSNQLAGTTNVWRLYNPTPPPAGGQHYYTLNSAERDFLVSIGWVSEGFIGYMHGTAPQFDAVREVFHMYKPNAPGAGDRLYTSLAAERDALLASGQWQQHTSLGFGFGGGLAGLF